MAISNSTNGTQDKARALGTAQVASLARTLIELAKTFIQQDHHRALKNLD